MLDTPVHNYPRRALITAILILAGLFLLTFSVMPWDLRWSMGASRLKIPGDLRRMMQFGEVFAHTLGCFIILGSLLWIDVRNRGKLWLASAFVMICGTMANAAKYLIPRHRPYTYTDIFPETSWETFGSPFTKSWLDESIRSFPSGHSATAAAMAIGLSYVYPRGRWLFLSLAILAAAQRLFSGAHYASDILAGVSITFLIAVAWIWLASRQHVAARRRSHPSEDDASQAAQA